ncbi:MAG: hypothetical protein R3C14_48480 [Caldilineaceae bacterium]
MYAITSTAQLKPQCLATFCQRWRAIIEPAIDQFPALIDLYVLVNPETNTLLVFSIYASEADALAAGAHGADQQWVQQCADLLRQETVTHTGYIIISA